MNSFEIKKTKTEYGYEYLGIFIDDIPLDIYLYKATSNDRLKGLMPCFFEELDSKSEQEYISESLIIESKEGINLPILLCPEDMDFWCTVIVAKIIYTDDCVIWNKIGIVKKENWNTEAWVNSGIRNYEIWTDEEWTKYGSYFDLCNLRDSKWDDWISNNWQNEESRRIHSYTHEYFNKDENIEWLNNIPKLVFDINKYKNSIKKKNYRM